MTNWLETWTPTDILLAQQNNFGAERLQLAAAAPDMCRALLKVEAHYMCCIRCIHSQNAEQRAGRIHVDCYIDAALTKAGLPDQASRDAARKELGL